MSKIRVGINGFGRIGRITFRAILVRNDVEVVGINDLLDVKHLAYLLKYDSVHGKLNDNISTEEDFLIVNGNRINHTNNHLKNTNVMGGIFEKKANLPTIKFPAQNNVAQTSIIYALVFCMN